ncbi:MAG: glycosyltransferase family 1 protein [Chitinivibrionales bacterium]|nr:glycosyltransferase family 1 protein [Chitinivibrionales bacterium]
MRIAFDCRPLQTGYAGNGVGTFVRNVAARLARHPIAENIIFCGASSRPPFPGVHYYRLHRPPLRAWMGEQLLWPLDIKRMKADVFHATVSLGPLRDIGFPLWCPAAGIATIHDLNCLSFGPLSALSKTKSFWIQRRAVKRARHIITVSKHVKNDIIKYLNVPEEKILVVPEAVDDALREIVDRKLFEKLPESQKPFILGMGETANKNIAAVIKVFEQLAQGGYTGFLRIIGRFEDQIPEVKALYNKSLFKKRIFFPGRLELSSLAAHYAQCSFFIFPSFCEGFGLPLVEAMYCGAPVIAADTTSLPEAGGSAAQYEAPTNIAGMATLARRILDDGSFRGECVRRGRQHAGSLSWDKTVEVMVALYEKLASPDR